MGVLESGTPTRLSICVLISHLVKVARLHEIDIIVLVVFCSAPVVPTNARISNQSWTNINSIYLEGTNITFLCDNGSQTLLTSTCYTNGNWSPSPSKLDCSHTGIQL